MTLSGAIAKRLSQATLIGWRLSKRRMIEMSASHAILTLGWLDDRGLFPADGGDQRIGDSTISLDLYNLPDGISVDEWSALPDSCDLIEVPTDGDIRAAAISLGCRYIDRGEQSDGAVIYWMVA
jgi:hypothetical protein